MTKIIPLHQIPLKLKINLENMPFPIYRKVLVPSDIQMDELHLVIQVAMGWENAHLYQFSDKKGRSKIMVQREVEKDEFWGGLHGDEFNADEISLMEFLAYTDGKTFWYWYDFGDDWWHKISIQKVTKKDLADTFGDTPFCTEAKGLCPPEDCGGPWGFANLEEAINEPKHPEYKEYREWLGIKGKKKIDFEKVDLDEINDNLDVLWNGWIDEEGDE
ncbi:plasmid pRiA4b ORF-3 family protein [Arthrospiribacter ruber]|uniref:Plasmid pRiA4b ORF-3 family protein n=1 Tax=Arthrospiribacter ruber TaxID=2487934 RepID=A0A951MDL7_9BACT|nr:plasmid pRiA4b ORF-3 family protein [Arthrospiribacter ruber]MBW3469134.1 plasmid pRiA4b ORF-3 family protein [Arthrospiribacter ruber]